MAYMATTPWEYQTWGANKDWPDKYTRLSQRQITGGTTTGEINPFITDIARGVTLIVNGSSVEATSISISKHSVLMQTFTSWVGIHKK
jgi:hypothetical protein